MPELEEALTGPSRLDHSSDASTVTCPACSGAARHLVSSTDLNRKISRDIFHYFACQACGLVFMQNIPEDLGRYYAGGYQKLPQTLATLRQMAEPERFRLEPILRYKSGGRLLEVGPWVGLFSSNAKDAGFEVTAIERDGDCVDFLAQTLGIAAVQSNDPAATLAAMPDRFDVIALWHSLEHLPQPWGMLAEAALHLKPGGILLVAMPNIASYDFALLRANWTHLDAPRHLYFYPPAALTALCQTNGLRLLELTTEDQLSLALGAETWNRWANLKVPVRYVRGLVRAAGLAWSRRQAHRHQSGSGLTAVFQKPL